MAAAKYDLYIEQGADFEISFTITQSGVPYNLVGSSAALQIRDYGNNLFFDGTSNNGKLIINTSNSSIKIKISNAETSSMLFTTGKYDLELTDSSGFVIRLLEGAVSVSCEVTKT